MNRKSPVFENMESTPVVKVSFVDDKTRGLANSTKDRKLRALSPTKSQGLESLSTSFSPLPKKASNLPSLGQSIFKGFQRKSEDTVNPKIQVSRSHHSLSAIQRAVQGGAGVGPPSSPSPITRGGGGGGGGGGKHLRSGFSGHEASAASFTTPNKSGRMELSPLKSSKSAASVQQAAAASPSPPPGLGSSWGALKSQLTAASKFSEKLKRTSSDTPAESARDRRAGYQASLGPRVGNLEGVIRLSKGAIKVSELLILKGYFDEMDLDSDGTVTMEEVRVHRQNKRLREETERRGGRKSSVHDANTENIMDVSLGIDQDLTFQDLLQKVHPHLNKTDLEMCMKAIPMSDKKSVTESAKRTHALNELLSDCHETWMNICESDSNIVTEDAFDRLTNSMLGDEAEKANYWMLVDPVTKLMHREQFTTWWVNTFGEEEVEWHDIQDHAEAFWIEVDRDSVVC